MTTEIPIPDASWSEITITLGGQEYSFVYRWNERDESWRIDIFQEGNLIIGSVKILLGVGLIKRYLLEDFNHGELVCIKFHEDENPIGRYNLGFNKAYRLLYFSNQELEDLEDA